MGLGEALAHVIKLRTEETCYKNFIRCTAIQDIQTVAMNTVLCHSPTSRPEPRKLSAIFLNCLPIFCQSSLVLWSVGTTGVLASQQVLLRRLGRRGGGRGGLTPTDGMLRLGGGTGASSDGGEMLSVTGIKSGSGVTRRVVSLSMACSWFWVTDGSALLAAFAPSSAVSLLSVSLSAEKEKKVNEK